MVKDLKQKAAKGLVWKFIEQGGTQLIQFVSGIYIARILSPEDYGLVGMMAIFLGISQMFINSGFRATLIQKGVDTSNDDYNVVFIFNTSVSILLYFIIYYTAPFISGFYQEPKLLPVARVLGLNLILMSLCIIQQTILEKRLNFRTLAKVRLISILLSAFAGILLAVSGFGVWSLVSMILVENFVRTIMLWILNKWIPSFSFNTTAFRDLYKKGIKIFFAGILEAVSQNIYALVIGKFYSTADVGYFSQGKKLQQRIGDFIVYSMQGVMFPVQALMKDDIPRLKNAVRKNVKFTTLITFPAVVGLIVIANPFIELFLTEKWLPSVYYLQVLSFAGLFFILRGSVNSHIMPLGKFNIIVLINVFQAVSLILLIVVTLILDLGLEVLVLGKLIQEVLTLMLVIYYTQKFINYSMLEIFKDAFPPIIFSTIMALSVMFIGTLLQLSFVGLIVQVVFGALVYLSLNYFFNRKLSSEIISQIKPWIKKSS